MEDADSSRAPFYSDSAAIAFALLSAKSDGTSNVSFRRSYRQWPIPAIGPVQPHAAIVLLGSFHEIGLDMESRPPDLSGIGKALEVGPCQVAERLPGCAHKSLRTQVV